MNRIGVKAAALIISLPLFLLACEKDLAERGSGKKVTINFTVANEGYGADQQIMKSGGANEAKPETVYMPLNDNYFIAATLAPEPAAKVRAAVAFATGQKIRFVAYRGATEEGSAIYTWDGSKFTPDDEPLGVEPDNDVLYHFVAYSFFGDPMTEPDDEDVEEGILPAQDLVWGEKDQKIYDNETSRTVPILMKHKFSRVQVKVDASSIDDAQVTGVSGVVIAGGKKADLTVRTGSVAASSAAGSDVTATLGGWTSEDGGKARLSGYTVFYPSLTTITLATLDITIDEVPLTQLVNQSVTFTQALAENTSYRVVVDVRANRFAYSNIYWDSGSNKLTFDVTDLGHQRYEGVFFKFGSLVGISPVGGFSSSTTILYKPTEIITGAYASYSSIPYWNTNNDVGNPSISTLKGDICKYINPNYRLPKLGEFPVTGWTFQWVHGYTRLSDGTTMVDGYGISGALILPTSEWLQADGSFPEFNWIQHSRCYLWFSSAYDATQAHCFAFNNNDGLLPHAIDRHRSNAIRCIRN